MKKGSPVSKVTDAEARCVLAAEYGDTETQKRAAITLKRARNAFLRGRRRAIAER